MHQCIALNSISLLNVGFRFLFMFLFSLFFLTFVTFVQPFLYLSYGTSADSYENIKRIYQHKNSFLQKHKIRGQYASSIMLVTCLTKTQCQLWHSSLTQCQVLRARVTLWNKNLWSRIKLLFESSLKEFGICLCIENSGAYSRILTRIVVDIWLGCFANRVVQKVWDSEMQFTRDRPI